MKKLADIRFLPPFFFLLLIFFVALEMRWLESLTSDSGQKQDAFDYYAEQTERLFSDLECFPVVKETADGGYPVTYENSWGAKRSYGGERRHEGCDLMALKNERGRYEVCSMTDGTVRKIGWLEKGGWRIGIESDSGIYYYYAHLDSYEKAFAEGERIAAGDILGRMGDSGYGKEPGTKGKFDVHLHVGIYLTDQNGRERPVNPYWYLRQLEN